MSEKNKRYGVIGTTVFHALLLLLLIFFGLSSLPQEEEGILVNFGDTVIGQGKVEPKASQSEAVKESTPPPKVKTPEPVEPDPVKEEIETQDYDEAPVVKTEAEKKKEREEKERQDRERREREEAERIRQAEIKKQQEEEAERKRLEEEARKEKERLAKQAADIQKRTGNAFSKGTGDNTSEGNTGGSGNQGHTTGDPNSRNRDGSGKGNKGYDFGLGGRSTNGVLPKPLHNINEAGTIVVRIRVDRRGNVISAVAIPGNAPLISTLYSNERARKNAEAAAMKAKFTAKDDAAYEQEGWIRYFFELE